MYDNAAILAFKIESHCVYKYAVLMGFMPIFLNYTFKSNFESDNS